MANPLEKCIAEATRTGDEIASLFAKIGSSEHPRGFVLVAYRNARRSMRSALKERYARVSAHEVVMQLRTDIQQGTQSLFSRTQACGTATAKKQLGFYGIEENVLPIADTPLQNAVSAVLARLDAQETAIRAVLATTVDTSAILGDEERVGLLRPGDVMSTASFWAAALLWDSFAQIVSGHENRFSKQAIAALDPRTTNCCLRVHGQVRPLNKPFELDGTPRFSDRMDWSPFHHRCRTAVALYDPAYDDGLTERMREAAKRILMK